MSVRYKDDVPRIKIDFERKSNVFLRNVLEAIELTSTPKTPRKFGSLRSGILKTVLGKRGIIKWLMDYAVFQEEKQFTNYTTPGTGPHFARNAVNKEVGRVTSHLKKSGLI